MWTTRTLGEISDEVDGVIQTGPFGSQLHESDYVEDGIPVVMPKNILDGKIDTSDIAFIKDEDAERLQRHKMCVGDIVYGRRGDIGRRGLIGPRENGWLCGTGCLRVSLGDRVLDPTYLYYFLGQPIVVGWIANQAIGATMPNLNTGILRSVAIRYPRLPVQRRIASILSAYDDLIENNTRRIKILEEMAQMIYREWFVNFRFPGHEKVRMRESELGPIPKGWTVVGFDEISDILSGGTPKTTEPAYWNGPIPFFGPTDAPDSDYVIGTTKSITELGLGKCNSKLYPAETVFITARGTVGKVALPACSMAMNQSCYALRGKPGINQLALFLITKDCARQLKQKSHGAVFDTITVETFQKLRLVRPTDTLLSRLESTARPMFGLVLNLLRSNATLRTTRDLLLPKLISGEIPVEAADEFIAATT